MTTLLNWLWPLLWSFLWSFLFITGLALLAGGWLWGPPLWTAWRRARIRARPFPPAWRDILRRRMPAFAALPADLQWQVKKHAQVLLAEKPFVGCAGLAVTDEMRVLVAAQAALLLLNRRAGYFSGLRQILLYPGAFVVERSHSDAVGVTHDSRRALAGESWQQGQVLLAWDSVLAGAADPHDGHNVVIHEFAHQLDQQKGRANGVPLLGRRERYARWAAVMGAEFMALERRLALGEAGLIAADAATDAVEFFAVVSEHFFEQPQQLAAAHPVLFAELARYYCVNPLSW